MARARAMLRLPGFPGDRVFIIAEAGVNHNGDPALARQLVDAAVAAGADAVKFQTFSADELVSRDAPKAKHHEENLAAADTHYAMLRRLELPRAEFARLQEYCAGRNIMFLSTPYDLPSAEFLITLGLPAYKVASSELGNLPLLRTLARAGKPLILSAGMHTLAEAERSVACVRGLGVPVALLQCTANYPVALADVNLRVLTTFRERFPDVPVGFSDHTDGNVAAVAAVALGAAIVEKHLTLDRGLPGPDHRGSLEPGAFAQLVRDLRDTETALGSAEKTVLPCEVSPRAAMTPSIVARQALAAGTVLTAELLALRRPAGGLPPAEWDGVIGRRTARALAAGEALTGDALA